jgi:hypothetical protein
MMQLLVLGGCSVTLESCGSYGLVFQRIIGSKILQNILLLCELEIIVLVLQMCPNPSSWKM